MYIWNIIISNLRMSDWFRISISICQYYILCSFHLFFFFFNLIHWMLAALGLNLEYILFIPLLLRAKHISDAFLNEWLFFVSISIHRLRAPECRVTDIQIYSFNIISQSLEHLFQITFYRLSNPETRLNASGIIGIVLRVDVHMWLHDGTNIRSDGLKITNAMDQVKPEPNDCIPSNWCSELRTPNDSCPATLLNYWIRNY